MREQCSAAAGEERDFSGTMECMESLRVDKWLWAARFFKTRAVAAKACELGRVLLKGQPLKPAREVHAGDRLRVRTEGGEFDVDVLALSEARGPAPVAQALYRETDESRAARQRVAEERRALAQSEELPGSRPSKRDRRELRRVRGRG